jgi:hypothetical protein
MGAKHSHEAKNVLNNSVDIDKKVPAIEDTEEGNSMSQYCLELQCADRGCSLFAHLQRQKLRPD